MSEDFTEPDWLKDYTVWQNGEFLFVACKYCGEDGTVSFEDGTTLYDMKLWAYYHIEECGK